MILLLDEYIRQLELTYQYASDTIRGLERIKRFQSPGGSGFPANLLESLGEVTRTEVVEIEKSIDMMEERYRVGDKLFDIILDKAGKLQPAPG